MARRRRHSTHRRRSFRRHRRATTGPGGKIWRAIKGVFRKPVSHLVAPALGVAALLQLFTPLPNGDGFFNRLNFILKSLQPGQTPNILGDDGQGNNILTIVGPQLLANALPAALTGIGAAILYKIGRVLGM